MDRPVSPARQPPLAWLGALLPLSVMMALGGLDLLPDLLDRTIATRLLAGATVLGMAAFAGGALYLVISVLFGVASEAVLRSRLADSDKPERRPVEQREDDDNYSDRAMVNCQHSACLHGFL